MAIIRAPAKDVNGKCVLDEDFLREHEGITDFSKYALVPGTAPRRIMPAKMPDLTVAEQNDEGARMDSQPRELFLENTQNDKSQDVDKLRVLSISQVKPPIVMSVSGLLNLWGHWTVRLTRSSRYERKQDQL